MAKKKKTKKKSKKKTNKKEVKKDAIDTINKHFPQNKEYYLQRRLHHIYGSCYRINYHNIYRDYFIDESYFVDVKELTK